MLLYAICPSCRARVDLRSSATTPQDLERQRGEHLDLTCDGCQTSFRFEAMQTRARVSPLKVAMGLGLSIVLAVVIWEMGYIALIAAAPAFIILATEQNSVKAYNSLSRRRYG